MKRRLVSGFVLVSPKSIWNNTLKEKARKKKNEEERTRTEEKKKERKTE